ncbi:MAG: CHASE2 domain-containing protein [Verrucomicrobia bacterium]|nr:CHASE2 domain-containing protein [Verrucomicrobiota bacterium]
MKLKPLKLAPAFIATLVIALVCLVRVLDLSWVQRLENMTYDQRVRVARSHTVQVATNLGFVFIGDDTITSLGNGSLGFRYGLYWPRHVQGRVLRELTAQGARAVCYDVMFSDRRFDHAAVPVSVKQWPDLREFLARLHPGKKTDTFEQNGEEFTLVESDEYFAWQLRRSGRAVVAAEKGVLPNSLFANNASAKADISADIDPGGVLRRARTFQNYRKWHPAFRQAEAEGYIDLHKAQFEPGQIVFPRAGDDNVKIPVDAENNFDLADFGGEKLPVGMDRKAKAFTEERVWHMGVVLAARELNLDLDNADVNLRAGRITLRSTNGVERVLPVDSKGYFLINWEISPTDRQLTREAFERLLIQDQARNTGLGESLTNVWKDKLVVIGSSATGNDLTDHGATPLEKDTLLVSKHWNVANSIITGRFVRTAPLAAELLLIILLGGLTAWLTWQSRALTAALAVIALVVGYTVLAFALYNNQRIWLPLILPVGCAVLMQYICVQTYRVVFEQRERRRVIGVFGKMVSPKVAREVLKMESLSLGGSRKEITVYFADVRGFTELTDATNERAAQIVVEGKLTGHEAEAVYGEHARELLETVNTYLSLVADVVKQHDGTLDKFIGDCVMSYWGAPTSDEHHALHCVRAAVDAQRAIHELNLRRFEQNKVREQENIEHARLGRPLLPMLPVLYLGSGINSGVAVAGFMGSEKNERSYTVFGREVNLASRLESVSGRGRIIIGEATYEALLRDDPALAATCIEQEPTKPKGFNKPVRNFEVPWQQAENSKLQVPSFG